MQASILLSFKPIQAELRRQSGDGQKRPSRFRGREDELTRAPHLPPNLFDAPLRLSIHFPLLVATTGGVLRSRPPECSSPQQVSLALSGSDRWHRLRVSSTFLLLPSLLMFLCFSSQNADRHSRSLPHSSLLLDFHTIPSCSYSAGVSTGRPLEGLRGSKGENEVGQESREARRTYSCSHLARCRW